MDLSPEKNFRHLSKLAYKESETPDGIPSIVYKKLGKHVCHSLSLLFKRSLHDAELPKAFTTVIIHPMHKKGNKTVPSNKRPVSLTVEPCKLLESIIGSTIYNNADSQRLITKYQFAYRPGYSTVLQLLETQIWAMVWATMANKSERFDVFYFDFKSAFESVTHSKLLEMLSSWGVGNCLVAWIKAFLTGRTFRVRVNNTYSTRGSVTSGGPQGTILGPLMYIMCINSLQQIMPVGVHDKVYADDIKIYSLAETEAERQKLQETLTSFKEWSDSLDLKLSVEKCGVLHFGHSNVQHNYLLEGKELMKLTVLKDLGVLTHTNLKYSEHVSDIVKRANQRGNWLLKAKTFQ